MAKEYKLSAERLEELKQELTYLKTVREKEVADQIKEARSFGDLSENSEYDEAKNEQGKLYSRIAELDETKLRNGKEPLMVTTRDIDQQVRDLGKVIGYGINWALQGLEIEEMNALLS